MSSKRVWILVVLVVGCMYSAPAQDLYGEGQDQVKLVWIPKDWPAKLVGWDLKRRKNAGEWVKLNKEIIRPEVASGKSLASATNSPSERTRLSAKQNNLLTSGKLKEKGQQKFIEELKTADGRFGVAFTVALDYDLALIMGFGYLDQNFEGKGEYEYGLFQQFEDGREPVLAANFSWQYGTKADIDVPMEGVAKSYGKKGVEVTFNFKKSDYDAINPLGVNVYRKNQENGDYTKLNKRVVLVNASDDDIRFTYLDKEAVPGQNYIYALAPVTVFKTEGARKEASYQPVKTSENITAPVLQRPEMGEEGLKFQWEFESGDESYIQGFYVQLKEKEGFEFTNVSDLLPSSVRSFAYKDLPGADGEYYHFKVVAIKNDDLELWSNRTIFFNKIDNKPSRPENLQAEIINSGSDLQVRLTWQKPAQNAEHVTEYFIYTSSPNQDRVVKEGSIGTITDESYIYQVYRERSASYSFAVSATNTNHEESPLSEKVTVTVPSKSLPFINIWPISKEGRRVTLNWKYPNDIADLAGFRLFQNGELIIDESELDANSRQWVSQELDPGRYTYEIVAVSLTNVESERSDPRKFEIE